MKRIYLLLLLVIPVTVNALTVNGIIIDKSTREEIIGASIVEKENPDKGTISSIDGTFNIDIDPIHCHTLVCSYMGYKTFYLAVDNATGSYTIELESDEVALNEVTCIAVNPGRTESGARAIERKSMAVVNVMSARAIELSSDMTAAAVVSRMSGVTVERNSSGEGQYAILRGMDKRYNYTLVNGVKIPSPDPKNRFVPLDIFPSEMLDRLEVNKSLTAAHEGDGIGGAVDLIMKDAPTERCLTANISTGYNAQYFSRPFQSFSSKDINRLSPYELHGKPDDYRVTMDDFTTSNLRVDKHAALPDLNAGISYGDRFFGNRLGIIAAASILNTARGKQSAISYQPGTSHYGTKYRNYSSRQMRYGAHLKADFRFNPQHDIMWYGGYTDMTEHEIRDGHDDKQSAIRLKYNHQYIFNSTLRGEHLFLDNQQLSMKWAAVYSQAYNETPDCAEIFLIGTHVATTDAARRRWSHNTDRDIAGYLDLSYRIDFNTSRLDLSTGAMYRDKSRSSFFNEYTFNSATGTRDPQYQGQQWTNYDQILFTPRPYGNIGDPLNYDAAERIGAAYLMAKYSWYRLEVIAGIRAEHTDQGYTLLFPREVDPEGRQIYTDWLPSAHVKYEIHRNANLRASYYRAINRPGFFEIVPYSIIEEDYKEKGNPALKHTIADNVDLRYEYFPASSDQIMVCVFYKHIQDPIEYGLITEGQDTYYRPMNFGNATNLGIEIDAVKHFGWFGIKANYTYTHSSITTEKRIMDGDEITTVRQTRPLYGQAAHVANLALMANDSKTGWDAQIACSYTGRRLADISNWYNDDIWERGYFQLDASISKAFKCGVSVFAKASNLINSPLMRYIQAGPHTENVPYERYNGNVVERREWHGQNISVGIKYKL